METLEKLQCHGNLSKMTLHLSDLAALYKANFLIFVNGIEIQENFIYLS